MNSEPTLADIALRLDELTRAVVAPPRKYFSPEEASAYLGLSVPLLAKWRMEGDGPAFSKLGSRVSYAVADLDQFMAERRVGGRHAA
jgi:hypothetical protein